MTEERSRGSHIADPGKQARSASGIPIVPVFDGYRALAILGVVMLHLFSVSGVIGSDDTGLLARLNWGFFGRAVEVLFVVSGFVVFLPTVAREGEFGSWFAYAIRRGARLLPAYWLILVISLILLATVDLEAGDIAMPSTTSVLAHFTGFQLPLSMLSDQVVVGFFVNPPLWTLSVELGFYVVLALVAVRYFRHPFIGLAIAAAITIAWDLFFDNYYDILSLLDLHPAADDAFRFFFNSGAQLPAWALSFGLGMTGAWVYVRIREAPDPERFHRPVMQVLCVSVVATIVLALLNGGYYDQSRQSLWLSMIFSVTMASAMVALALAPRVLQLPFANTPIRRLGDISYGIYLCHMLLLIYLGDMLDLPEDGTFTTLLLWVAAVLPASVLYGYLSARFVEQPIRRWARKFGRRKM